MKHINEGGLMKLLINSLKDQLHIQYTLNQFYRKSTSVLFAQMQDTGTVADGPQSVLHPFNQNTLKYKDWKIGRLESFVGIRCEFRVFRLVYALIIHLHPT